MTINKLGDKLAIAQLLDCQLNINHHNNILRKSNKGKNIENENVNDKNEGIEGNVRVMEVPPSVCFHFQQFYHSTFRFSTLVGRMVFGYSR